jgi:hypothetical protein
MRICHGQDGADAFLNPAACDGSRSATRPLALWTASADHLKAEDSATSRMLQAITATGGLMAIKSSEVLRAMSIATIHAHCTFLSHVTQLEVASPGRMAPAAGDASVPLSWASSR